MNRKQGSTIKYGKMEKSITFKMYLNDRSEEEDENKQIKMTFVTTVGIPNIS